MTTLFDGLAPDDLDALHSLSQVVSWQASEVVVEEGTPGTTLFLIDEGVVAVTKRKRGKEVELLNILTAGGYFGEMALINVAPRSATVATIEPCRMRTWEHEAITQFVQERPDAGLLIYRNFATTLSHGVRRLTEKYEALSVGREPSSAVTHEHDQLMALVDEQLRTPAILLKGMAELLSEEWLTAERRHYFLQVMTKQSEALANALKVVCKQCGGQ